MTERSFAARVAIGVLAMVAGMAASLSPALANTQPDTAGTPARTLIQMMDDREPVSTDQQKAFSALVELDAPRIGVQGTGMLVGRCHVLTNRHVVMSRSGIDGHVRIWLGEAEHRGRILVAGDSFDTLEDWALLVMQPCAPADLPTIEVVLTDPRSLIDAQTALQVAGFPHDKDRGQLWRDPWCNSGGLLEGGLITHNCTIGSGNSGGPLLLQRTATGPRLGVVGLNAAIAVQEEHGGTERVAFGNDPFRFAISIPMLSLLPRLQEHVPDLVTSGTAPALWPPEELGAYDRWSRNRDAILAMARRGNLRALMEVCIHPKKYRLRLERERAQHCRTLGRLIEDDAWKGSADLQLVMGWLMQTGLGGREDRPAAVEWYRRAARQGDEVAVYNLALAYLEGDGIEANREAGLRLLRHAVELGYPPASKTLEKTLAESPR